MRGFAIARVHRCPAPLVRAGPPGGSTGARAMFPPSRLLRLRWQDLGLRESSPVREAGRQGGTQVGCIWLSEHVTGPGAPGGGAYRAFSARHRKPSRWYRLAGYFQRKCTNSRPKFLESFSTR